MQTSMAAVGAERYAGFGVRLVAYIIDAIIVAVVVAVLRALGQAIGSDLLATLGSGVGSLIGIIYYVYFWGSSGQTPGKRIMGLRVIGRDGGTGGIGYGAAFLRWIGYIISAVVIFIGFLWIIWDPERQGWHDKIAGTHVIRG